MLEAADIPLVAIDPTEKTDILSALESAVVQLKSGVDGVYLHIDMDVLESEQGKPNHLAVPGGLPPAMAANALQIIKKHVKLEGCALASYDPEFDKGNSVLNDGFRLIKTIFSD